MRRGSESERYYPIHEKYRQTSELSLPVGTGNLKVRRLLQQSWASRSVEQRGSSRYLLLEGNVKSLLKEIRKKEKPSR